MDNCRKSLRIPIASVAHVTHQDTQLTTKILIRDLSISGLGGYINCPCQRGDHFLVHLKLTDSDNEVVEASLTGEICWSTEIGEGEKYAFGLAFPTLVLQHPRLHAYLLALEKSYRQELEEIYQLP